MRFNLTNSSMAAKGRWLTGLILALTLPQAHANSCDTINFSLLEGMSAMQRIAYIEQNCQVPDAGQKVIAEVAPYKSRTQTFAAINALPDATKKANALEAAEIQSNKVKLLSMTIEDYEPRIKRAIASADYQKARELLEEYETSARMVQAITRRMKQDPDKSFLDGPLTDTLNDATDRLGVGIPNLNESLNTSFTRGLWGNFVPGFIVNFKDEGDVKNASVEPTASGVLATGSGGIVRLETDGDDIKAGVAMFAHVYPWVKTKTAPDGKTVLRAFAFGPYVSIMPASDDLVDVLGVGLSLGFVGNPNYRGTNKLRTSLNFNLGYFLDFDALRVEDGFSDGQLISDSSRQIEIEEYTDEGLQFGISFSIFTQ